MSHDPAIPHLGDVLLFLGLAGVLVPLLQKWRINSVLGFLLVGMVLGPLGLGRFVDAVPALGWVTFSPSPAVGVLGELGVMFLMFAIGLELSTERLWSLRRWVFGAGSAQVLLTTAAVAAVVAWQGRPAEAAVVVGLIAAFSSTAVVMQLLTARHELGTPTGRAVFSVLLLQDLAVVPALIVVGILGGAVAQVADSPENVSGWAVAVSVLLALIKGSAAIALINVLGQRSVRPLFRLFASTRQADTFMALTLLTSLGIAALTWLLGLSMALGAFLAGLMLAETEYRHEVEVAIEPFRGLLMGLFFMSVGMGIDPAALLADPVRLPIAVVGLMLIKATIAAIVLRGFGLTSARSLEGGMLLSQAGEFGFVVVGAAAALGVLSPPDAAFVMLTVGLTLFLSPMAAFAGRSAAVAIERFSARFRKPDAEGEEQLVASGGVDGHVILAGYGRVGQLVSHLLDGQQIAWVAVDEQPQAVARFHAHGLPVYVGDAGRAQMLHRLGADSARMVVLTMDDPVAALRALKVMRERWPSVPVLARARDEEHAAVLRRNGAHEVVPEAFEAALQLGARSLGEAGFTEDLVSRIIDLERSRRAMGWQREEPQPPAPHERADRTGIVRDAAAVAPALPAEQA